MKKFLYKITSPFRHILFGVVAILLGAICLLGGRLIPHQNPGPFGSIDAGIIYTAAMNNDQSLIAYVDSTNQVYVIQADPEDPSLQYMITAGKLPLDDLDLMRVTFDDEDNLYVLCDYYDSNQTYRDAQYIYKFTSKGKYAGEVIHYDFTDIPEAERDARGITAMNYYDGKLHYVKLDDSNSAYAVMAVEPDSSEVNPDYYFEDIQYIPDTIRLSDDGVVSVVSLDGWVYVLYPDDTARYLAVSDYDSVDNPNGSVYTQALWNGEGVFIVDGITNQNLLYTTDGENFTTICDANGLYYDTDGEDGELSSLIGSLFNSSEDSGSFNELYEANGSRIIFSIDSSLYVSNLDSMETDEYFYCDAPVSMRLLSACLIILQVIGGLLLVLGAISIIGCLMGWHFSLLSKQLWTMIPVLVVAMLLTTTGMIRTVTNTYYNSLKQELSDVSAVVAAGVDREAFGEMTGLNCVTEGGYQDLSSYLDQVTSHNTNSLSQTFDMNFYIPGEGDYYYLAASSLPKTQPFSGWVEIDFSEAIQYRYLDTDTYILSMDSLSEEYMTAQTPIYDEAGNIIALLELSTPLSDYDSLAGEVTAQMVRTSLILIAILVVIMVIISYINTRYLKKAGDMVTRIAGGDFSVRIDHAPKDEVGAICVGVSNMAGQLQEYFFEMDRNEQFYYKFVPEKFKELLHKEEFTDLSLGDAESMDLTVLFCDIRAFSLNSEMMTARENFEFVNIIYGIAGPIVRAHNGFVDKYIGDAVMALFENADDAINAGIDLYNQIALNPETAAKLGISSIDIGIGIHSGMARIGIVGEEARMSGTVISDTVNMSSRLESLTKQYKTAMLITKDTMDRMADPDRLNVRYLGMIQVAGVNEVKAVYEVLDSLDEGRKAARSAGNADFREAVRLFHLGNLEGALQLFRSLEQKTDSGSDPVPKKYADYIEELIRDEETEHRVFKFSRK